MTTLEPAKISLTIGVCALNEESNIQNLLKNLLLQSAQNYELVEIIVISDGSTDATARLVKELNQSKIRLLEYSERAGQQQRANEIFQLSRGQVTVLIDADVLPTSTATVENLVAPFLSDLNVVYTCGQLQAITPTTLVGHAALAARSIWDKIRVSQKGGNGFYACHGGLYALRSDFAKANPFPKTIWTNVGFHYFLCQQQNLKFVSVKDSAIFFRLPGTVQDYAAQMSRYSKEAEALQNYFGPGIAKEYYIPKILLWRYKFQLLFSHPLASITAVLLNIYVKFFKQSSKPVGADWTMVNSTKGRIE